MHRSVVIHPGCLLEDLYSLLLARKHKNRLVLLFLCAAQRWWVLLSKRLSTLKKIRDTLHKVAHLQQQQVH